MLRCGEWTKDVGTVGILDRRQFQNMVPKLQMEEPVHNRGQWGQRMLSALESFLLMSDDFLITLQCLRNDRTKKPGKTGRES